MRLTEVDVRGPHPVPTSLTFDLLRSERGSVSWSKPHTVIPIADVLSAMSAKSETLY